MENDHLHQIPKPPHHHFIMVWVFTAIIVVLVGVGWLFTTAKNLPLFTLKENVSASTATIQEELDRAGAELLKSFDNQQAELLVEEGLTEEEFNEKTKEVVEAVKNELIADEAITEETIE